MDPRATRKSRLTRVLIVLGLAAFCMAPPMPPHPGCWGPRRPPMPLDQPGDAALPR